jgi:hypothetical protein
LFKFEQRVVRETSGRSAGRAQYALRLARANDHVNAKNFPRLAALQPAFSLM